MRREKALSRVRTRFLVCVSLIVFAALLTASITEAQTADGNATLGERPYLLGDFRGLRPTIAEQGITGQASFSHYLMGTASGGRRQTFKYAAKGDYAVNINFMEMDLVPGLFLDLRLEHQMGENLGLASGALLPPALQPAVPGGENHELMLTNCVVMQALSEEFALFFGKMDTLNGDLTEFASGRGLDQFMNTSMIANPALLRTVPYSTMATGFVLLSEGEPWFTMAVLNPTDVANETGIDEMYAEGVVLAPEMRLPMTWGGRPGHVLVGGAWSSREYVGLGQDPRVLIPGVPLAMQQGSWGVYGNFDQYIRVDPNDPTKGWGVFGRIGITDGNPNPIENFYSFGVGGNSPLRGRSNDTFGMGWFYNGVSDELAPILSISDGQGVELFYNIAVTPWCNITPDLQIIEPGLPGADTAYIFGLRIKTLL